MRKGPFYVWFWIRAFMFDKKLYLMCRRQASARLTGWHTNLGKESLEWSGGIGGCNYWGRCAERSVTASLSFLWSLVLMLIEPQQTDKVPCRPACKHSRVYSTLTEENIHIKRSNIIHFGNTGLVNNVSPCSCGYMQSFGVCVVEPLRKFLTWTRPGWSHRWSTEDDIRYDGTWFGMR